MATILSLAEKIPRVSPSAFLAETCRVVGDVELGANCSVWYGAVLRGDVGRIVVGERTNIQDNACIHMTYGQTDAIVGAEVIVGHGAVIHGALVADRALVGINAVILDKVQLGEGAWVAAGTVVPPGMIVPPRMLVRGCPGKLVRSVTAEESRWAAEAVVRYLGLSTAHANAQGVARSSG